MKSFIKYSSLAFATALLSTGIIESGVNVQQAHAATMPDTTQTATKNTEFTAMQSNLQATPHLLTEDQAWNLISAKLESATEAQKQQIQQKIKASTNIEKDGNDTIATVSDISIERAYMSVLDPSALIVSARSTGKTKIVWHGAAKKGNVDIYLSAKWLNWLKDLPANTAVSVAMYALLTLAGGGAGVLNYALGKVVKLALDENIKHFKTGRVFKFRGWKYKGISHQ
ncbi:hypothetical protein ACFP1H_10410 [Secundilactobacillus hailunensis]|uniref:Uncharacterized protein n=1 Tax=Secundilactobacillus hailunensis TaxID=2559923 RepID=A0ABW1TAX0_9LACO|nr:hypothetical protein [Secundilactobacillus hailunensis]